MAPVSPSSGIELSVNAPSLPSSNLSVPFSTSAGWAGFVFFFLCDFETLDDGLTPLSLSPPLTAAVYSSAGMALLSQHANAGSKVR